MDETELLALVGRDGVRAVASYIDAVAEICAREGFMREGEDAEDARAKAAACGMIADMLRHIAGVEP